MPDLKRRDHFAIFSFRSLNILPYPITLMYQSPLLAYLGYRLRFQLIDVKMLKLKSIDKKLKKRAQAKRCQQTGCLQIPNQLWLPVEHFIMMEGNPTQLNHSSSLFLVLFVCWSWSVRLGNQVGGQTNTANCIVHRQSHKGRVNNSVDQHTSERLLKF